MDATLRVLALVTVLSSALASYAAEPGSLHAAARGNDAGAIGSLVRSGADVNAPDALGNTPLHVAARWLRADAVEQLLAAGADVRARDARGRTPLHVLGANARPDVAELESLTNVLAGRLIDAGADPAAVDRDGVAAWPRAAASRRDRQPSGYPSYDEIVALLQGYAADHPNICQAHNIGPSSTTKDIWALKITDNPAVEEDEPEFKYISTMHGDEITGVILCLNLIELLVDNYGSDADLTHLVDNIEIWIVPCMNPYGYINNTRYNAQGHDLNRSFPEGSGSNPEPNTIDGRPAEVGTIMLWSFDHSFTLAANYHGGAFVVNYPFDNDDMGSVFSPTPDEDLMVWISEEYTRHNPPLWASTEYHHGITNGAEWYSIDGGMQDWSYRYMGCNEVTIEVSSVKSPPYSQMPTFWNQNRESMLAYLRTCLIGVRGLVTDVNTGEPVAATVTVVGRDHDIYTDPDVGDYHRMLLPGTYDLRFAATGYDAVTIPNVVVNEGEATVLDVELGPSAQITYPDGGELLSTGTPVTITWVGNPAAQFHVQVSENYGQTDTESDGFESGALGPEYTTGGDADWFVTTAESHAGARSARGGDITDYDETWVMREVGGGELSFWYKVSSESGWDYFNFYIDDERLIHVSGDGAWTRFSTTVAAGTHTAKWEYTKDVSQSHHSDTVFIDDVTLADDQTSWSDVIGLTVPGATSAVWTPTTATPSAKVRVRAFYGEGVYGDWDESHDTFMVEVGAGLCVGDINCDGIVDFDDIDPFVAALGYPGGVGWPHECPWLNADCNEDGNVTFDDIDPFVGQIGTTCP